MGRAILLDDEVSEFCDFHDISKLEMEEAFVFRKGGGAKCYSQQKLWNHKQASLYMKWVFSMMLSIGYVKSLIAASMRKILKCLFAQLRSIQETNFMILFSDDFISMNLRDLRDQLNMYIFNKMKGRTTLKCSLAPPDLLYILKNGTPTPNAKTGQNK